MSWFTQHITFLLNCFSNYQRLWCFLYVFTSLLVPHPTFQLIFSILVLLQIKAGFLTLLKITINVAFCDLSCVGRGCPRFQQESELCLVRVVEYIGIIRMNVGDLAASHECEECEIWTITWDAPRWPGYSWFWSHMTAEPESRGLWRFW